MAGCPHSSGIGAGAGTVGPVWQPVSRHKAKGKRQKAKSFGFIYNSVVDLFDQQALGEGFGERTIKGGLRFLVD